MSATERLGTWLSCDAGFRCMKWLGLGDNGGFKVELLFWCGLVKKVPIGEADTIDAAIHAALDAAGAAR
jgi:hypothetical protein